MDFSEHLSYPPSSKFEVAHIREHYLGIIVHIWVNLMESDKNITGTYFITK